MSKQSVTLHRSLGAPHLWAIAVGLVISGEYFGWSYGWASAGTLGFLAATGLVALMYLALIFSYTELAVAMPEAGGPFVYVGRAFGPHWGAVAGFASMIELVFAPPAIALAIGTYLHLQYPAAPPKLVAIGAYAVFMGVNIAGVRIAASFEFVVTIAAIIELVVFMLVVWPGFSWSRFVAHGWAGHDQFSTGALGGIAASIPFAIWFFLAIEGVALAAEEARAPHRTLPLAYIGAVMTLLALAFGVMILAGGVGDWRTLANRNDPLPQAMLTVVGPRSGYVHMLVWLGLFGLIASLHGIIMGYARQIFAMARAGVLPAALGRVHPRFATPWVATVAGGGVGCGAIVCDDWLRFGGQPLTANLVTFSAFGALTLYVMAMAAVFRLRQRSEAATRPWSVPLYPLTPALALGLGAAALILMAVTQPALFSAFAIILGGMVFAVSRRSRSDGGESPISNADCVD